MYLHCTYQGSEKQSNLHKETANGGASSLTLPLIYLANRKKTLDLLKESQVPIPHTREGYYRDSAQSQWYPHLSN